MKKRIVALALAFVMGVGLIACGTTNDADEQANVEENGGSESTEVPETKKIKFGKTVGSNVLILIANKMGYFEEVGIEVEDIPLEMTGATSALLSGQVDFIGNMGSLMPLQLIAAGEDVTIFGGSLASGAISIIAKEGTEWNSVEDFVGKKVVCEVSSFPVTGPLYDLGYELSDVEWLDIPNHTDRIAAVVNGEADYAFLNAALTYAARKTDGIEIVGYQSECMPDFGCCRLFGKTEFVEENPITVKLFLKALIRAQAYLDTGNNIDTVVDWMVEADGSTRENVEAFMMNEECDHVLSPDPLKNSMVYGWDVLKKTGYLNSNAENINIEDHLNTELYKAALDEILADEEIYKENPEVYDYLKTYFEENNN